MSLIALFSTIYESYFTIQLTFNLFFSTLVAKSFVSTKWSHVVASQNGGSTDYIFPFRLRVLQWSRHLFNYWKNKKTIIEKNSSFY